MVCGWLPWNGGQERPMVCGWLPWNVLDLVSILNMNSEDGFLSESCPTWNTFEVPYISKRQLPGHLFSTKSVILLAKFNIRGVFVVLIPNSFTISINVECSSLKNIVSSIFDLVLKSLANIQMSKPFIGHHIEFDSVLTMCICLWLIDVEYKSYS